MHVKEIRYSMLRQTGRYENDRIEVTIELEFGEDEKDAIQVARQMCEYAVGRMTYKEGYEPEY